MPSRPSVAVPSSRTRPPSLIRPGTLFGPFALRALGQAREDDELIRQALARFEGTGLDWYAAETTRMLEAQT